ncbi:MAG: MgtC/SapB family protein [Lachnospiraceae bacterium]|nr:MgtC/SapB family protein [Lachnospiraceae bacterium]MBQ9563634.1 MgtC/SapB family protein [Lachnospiraceae bacterium]
MLQILNPVRNLNGIGVFLRMFLACLSGTLIGLERSAKNRPAGFRTHILVCIGGAMASMISLYVYLDLHLPADISRIGASVVSGLGFIGAGTIIITKKKTIKGLTTAAGLWACGILGLAIGAGYYELGILGTLMILFVETVLAHVGRYIQSSPEFILEMNYNEKNSLDDVMRLIKDHHMSVINLQIESVEAEGEKSYDAVIHVRGKMKGKELVSKIHQMNGISSVELR